MRFFRKEFRAGMPISTPGFADALRAMAKALERLEVVNGHVEWTSNNTPRLFFDAGQNTYLRRGPHIPFEIVDLSYTSVEVGYTYLTIQQVTKLTAGTISADLTGKTGDLIVSVKIKSDDLTMELVADAETDGVTHDETPPTDGYERHPLYMITRATEDNGWTVVTDLRKTVKLGAYM